MAETQTQSEEQLFLIEGKRRKGAWALLKICTQLEARIWFATPHRKPLKNYRCRVCVPGEDVTARFIPARPAAARRAAKSPPQ